MSVMQATSFAFQTSCAWCNAVREAVMAKRGGPQHLYQLLAEHGGSERVARKRPS